MVDEWVMWSEGVKMSTHWLNGDGDFALYRSAHDHEMKRKEKTFEVEEIENQRSKHYVYELNYILLDLDKYMSKSWGVPKPCILSKGISNTPNFLLFLIA